ncbi:SprT family zinc-dependent metalloprotease [Streptomyces avermitilis]|uniref:M48 family metallopeptidase n=1 Tax=Streptomyces avermitilis TaxID=33903 RepID=UPI00339E734F
MSVSVQSALAALPLPGEWTWQVVVRPRRRTLGIEIREDGGVLFAVPSDADPQAVVAAVWSRLPRIAHEVDRRMRGGGEPRKELVSGASFAYLGRRHRLRVVAVAPGARVRLHQGWLELPRPESPQDGARLIADWYTARGTEWMTARLRPLASRAGATPREVVVRDLGARWGACDPDGTITVHWALMQLPPALLDLVLVHELTHLSVPTHGPAFRRRMRLVIGNIDDLEHRFVLAERELWRGAV